MLSKFKRERVEGKTTRFKERGPFDHHFGSVNVFFISTDPNYFYFPPPCNLSLLSFLFLLNCECYFMHVALLCSYIKITDYMCYCM